MPTKRSANPPQLPTGQQRRSLLRRIDIYHPGYPGTKPLLSLHASDDGGVDYTVAYYACCIVAGNKWSEAEGRKADRGENDAFLSRSAAPKPIAIPRDNIMRAKRYYFHVPGYPNNRWPIVPNFNQWIFPKKMPLPWRSLVQYFDDDNITDDESVEENAGNDKGKKKAQEDTDEHSSEDEHEEQQEQPLHQASTANPNEEPLGADAKEDVPPAISLPNEPCRITGTRIGIDLAHVIPITCDKWFTSNFMREYSSTDLAYNDPINDSPNLIPLDIKFHRFFDYSNITIVPKPNYPIRHKACESYSVLTQVLRPPGKSEEANLEMIVSFHNLECRPMPRVPVEYLFARFAWSFFNDTIMLIFNDKETNDNEGFLLSLAEDGEDGNLKRTERECKRKFPKPRSGTRNKPGSKDVRAGPPPEEDGEADPDDALSVDTFEPGFYDSVFDDVFSHCSSYIDPDGSLVDPPRKRPRSESYSESDW
ncbi:hypothetical protein F5Y06DRAFT_167050 [Hypoxylon sp. FL0890]|nr:hypothetical protein F5Y06DRAFT_167050 [Hypoxylon sp. FL0890]